MFRRNATLSASLMFIAAVLILSGCTGGGPVSDDEIIATWDDTSMTVADFKHKMNVRFGNEANAMKKPYEDRYSILKEYVIRDCKIKEGYRLGFNEREDIQKTYNETVDGKLTDMLYKSKVRDSFITEDMAHEFYDHYKDEIRAQHILIAIPDADSLRKMKKDTLKYWERAREVYDKAIAGEDFDRLVDKYSDDDTIDRSLHGDLGYFKWGKMVDEFQEAAWKLDIGGISKPVRSSYGIHIIKLLDRRSIYLEANTSHILVKVSRRSSPAETTLAWDRAEEILKEAQKSGANFEQLARRYSEDEKTWANGEVGWVARGSMPKEYWDGAFTLKPSEVGGPYRTYKGYHIVKMHETRVDDKGFDDPDVRERTLAAIERVNKDTLSVLAEKYLTDLKNSFNMKYDPKVVKLLLRKLGDKSAPTNMNMFSSFTPEERKMLVVSDRLGGLSIQELVDRYGDHRFPPNYEDSQEFIEQLVEPVVLPKYLSTIARESGLQSHPDVIEEGKRALENAILPEVEREMVYNKATPTEDELKTYYEKNIKEYTDEAKVRVYEIQVDDKQLANDLLARVNKGEDIATLARRYSQRSMAKEKGGKLGPFTKDKYGDLSRKAFTMQVDEVAGPIESEGKYSIIKVIEKTDEIVKPFEEARRQVESDLRFQKQKDLQVSWEDELHKYYKVTFNEKLLKRVWPIVEPLGEAVEEEHKGWKDEREEKAKQMAIRNAEDQIKLKLQPGSEQEFTTKDGKQVQVKIGEPRYYNKDGEEVDPSKSTVKLTPKGRLEKKEPGSSGNKKPNIKIEPKTK